MRLEERRTNPLPHWNIFTFSDPFHFSQPVVLSFFPCDKMTKLKDKRREKISVATEVGRHVTRYVCFMIPSLCAALECGQHWRHVHEPNVMCHRVVDWPTGGAEGALPGQPGEGRVHEQEGETVSQGEVSVIVMEAGTDFSPVEGEGLMLVGKVVSVMLFFKNPFCVCFTDRSWRMRWPSWLRGCKNWVSRSSQTPARTNKNECIQLHIPDTTTS